jgi:hypothetical protein
MEDFQKEMLEIKTSGNENSNKIIKLVAAFKALLTKTNDNEVPLFKMRIIILLSLFKIKFLNLKKLLLKLEIILDSLNDRLKSNEKCFNRSIEMIEKKMERFANQIDNMEKQNSENGKNKRIDKVRQDIY